MPSVTRRYYSNFAPTQNLSGAITSASLTLNCASFSGWPASYPFTATIDYGLASAEIVLVTGISGTLATVTRAYDNSIAVAHSAGATFDLTPTAKDLDEANLHHSSNTGVHGVSGSVVGTSDVQTLSNKTFSGTTAFSGITGTSSTLTGGLSAATVAASGAVTGATATFTGALGAASSTITGNQTVQGSQTVNVNQTVLGNEAISGALTVTGQINAGTGVVGTTSWSSYTPAWNQAIGNGTISGFYKQIDKTVSYEISIVTGTTSATTLGTASGTFSWTLPVAANTRFGNTRTPVGSALYFGGVDVVAVALTVDSTHLQLIFHGQSAAATVGNPGGWGSGTQVIIQGTYEAA